ncbi:hypothetical protein N2152v2_008627 [Parachlorella kessleri]
MHTDPGGAMNVGQIKSTMHSLAFGQAMAQAAEDYKKEVLSQQQKTGPTHAEVDIDDLLDDPDLERLHAERLAKMRQEAERRVQLQQKGHGQYEEVQEGDFLEAVTKTERVVAHFFHREFERCRIMDKHLTALSKKYFDTRFIKLSAPDAPFFVEKLQVRMLPCVVMFVGGVAVDRIVGFEDLGGKDDFPTSRVEGKLLKAGIVKEKVQKQADSDDEEGMISRSAKVQQQQQQALSQTRRQANQQAPAASPGGGQTSGQRCIKLHTRLTVFKVLVLSVVLYGCESLALTCAQQHRLDVFVKGCMRRMLGLRWRDHISDEELYRRCGQEDKPFDSVVVHWRRRSLRFLGHLGRMPESRLAKCILWATLPEGVGRRGRLANPLLPQVYEEHLKQLDLSGARRQQQDKMNAGGGSRVAFNWLSACAMKDTWRSLVG